MRGFLKDFPQKKSYPIAVIFKFSVRKNGKTLWAIAAAIVAAARKLYGGAYYDDK